METILVNMVKPHLKKQKAACFYLSNSQSHQLSLLISLSSLYMAESRNLFMIDTKAFHYNPFLIYSSSSKFNQLPLPDACFLPFLPTKFQ